VVAVKLSLSTLGAMRFRLWMGSVAIPAACVGCTATTGAVQGGAPLSDADTVAQLDLPMGSTGGDASDGAPAPTTNNPSPDCQDGGMYGDNTWADLYQCYFGKSGPDSCAGTVGSCHGESNAGGTSFWTCGQTAASCYAGLLAGMTLSGPLDPTKDMANPTSAALYTVLCQINGSGMMPLGCSPQSVLLFPDDMARIAAWIAAGAPGP
jgi:hypothetical protein